MFYSKIYPKFMEETQKQKIREILEQVEVKGNILDIGSGPGFLEEFLPEAVAVDIDLENLREIKKEKVIATGDLLPFKKQTFDIAFCIDTIHKIENTSDIKSVSKKLVVSIFCNKHNFEKKKKWLKDKLNIGGEEKNITAGQTATQKNESISSEQNNISELTKDKLQKEPSEHINFRIEKEFLIKTKTEWDFVLVLSFR